MLNMIFYRISVLFVVLLLPSTLFSQKDITKIRKICIDAGHGGKDPGTIGITGLREKDITLKVALLTGKLIKIKYPNISIVYTRNKDVSVGLKRRAEIANSQNVDLFISIHINHAHSKSAKGVETYVLGSLKNDDNLRVAMKENSVIKYEEDYSTKYEGFDPSRAESYIMFSMMQNLHLDNSLKLASYVQSRLVGVGYTKDRGVRQDAFWVLKATAMPSILVELGFCSNRKEERFLRSKSGQNSMAKAIFRGFEDYKNKIEKGNVIKDNKKKLIKTKSSSNVKKKVGTSNTKVKFAIQVMALKNVIKDKRHFKGEKNIKYIRASSLYRYYIYESSSYNYVKANLLKARKKFKGCFIVGIYNGKIISEKEALNLSKNKI